MVGGRRVDTDSLVELTGCVPRRSRRTALPDVRARVRCIGAEVVEVRRAGDRQ